VLPGFAGQHAAGAGVTDETPSTGSGDSGAPDPGPTGSEQTTQSPPRRQPYPSSDKGAGNGANG
jgi:hypothetical protein